jgi:fructose-1,6-bisphosphatase
MLGLGGTENATGDVVKKLDLISNDAWVNSLIYSKQCAVLVSEEEEDAIIGEEGGLRRARLLCAASSSVAAVCASILSALDM